MNKKIILTLIILTIIICINTSTAQENTTITTIDVQTYTQLSNEIGNIKNSNTTETYQINLKKDNYTIDEDIRWMHDENEKLPNLIIDGHGSTINGSNTNVFLKTGRNTNLTLNNMTIVNTYDNTYSAIYNMGNLTLNNVIFKNNKVASSTLGGGAINNNGNLDINNATFINNTAIYGGAIFNFKTDFNNAHITINNTNFINNTAENGSCIYSSDAKLVVINNTNFTSNTAIDSMIYSNYNTQQITIENSNMVANTNTLSLINSQSNIEIINSTIKSNKNTNGALIKTTKSSIKNTQISNNSIDILVDANFNDVEIKNSNISENNIKNIAINNLNSHLYIQNNTFYANIVKNQALLCDISKTTNVKSNQFIDNKALNLFYGSTTTFNVVEDNIYVGNNLTNTTIKLDIKDEYDANENLTANITLMTNPIYNTTITTGTIKVSYNGIIIDVVNITNSTYHLNKNIDYVGVLPLMVEYCDDINFNSYKINKTTAIIAPSYQIKIMADDEYNLKDMIEYSIIVENQNNKTLHNIKIADVIASNINVINTSHKLDENNTWIIEKLTPGENISLKIKAHTQDATDIIIDLDCDMRFAKNTSTTIHNIKYKAPNYIIKMTPTRYLYGDRMCDFQIQNTGGVGYNINVTVELSSNKKVVQKSYTYSEITSNETITIKPDITILDIGDITVKIKIKDEKLNNNTILLMHNIAKPYIVFNDIYSNAASSINITAKVENINMSNVKIKSVFKLNSKTIQGDIKYTSGNVIVLNYNISTSIQNSQNKLDVVCNIGDLGVLRNSSNLYIVKLNTHIKLQDNIKITPGVNMTFKIRLVDENNNPVIKGRVVLKINKKTLRNSMGEIIYVNITGGVGEFTYMIPHDFVNSEYRFDVIYGENNMYNSCSGSTKLKIIKQDIVVKIRNSTYMVGDKFMVFVDIYANNTKLPIHDGNYALKINSKTLIDKVHISNSSISVCFENLNFSSISSITFCYSGNSAYASKKVVENLIDSRNLIIKDEEFTKIH